MWPSMPLSAVRVVVTNPPVSSTAHFWKWYLSELLARWITNSCAMSPSGAGVVGGCRRSPGVQPDDGRAAMNAAKSPGDHTGNSSRTSKGRARRTSQQLEVFQAAPARPGASRSSPLSAV